MKTAFTIVIFFSVCLSVATVQGAANIHLAVASSMTDVFNELTELFSSSHPGVKLQPNYASSGSLARQIEQGAPVDIYVSAHPHWMHYLKEQQLVEPDTVRIFVYNSLVFVSAGIRDKIGMEHLVKLDRIAIGTPQNVPAGQYARQAMENVGLYSTLVKERKLIMAKDVRQALLYADRGEVDGAFVYKTDALLATRASIIFTVPETLYERVSYPVALTANGAKNPSARAFHVFMTTPASRAVLLKYGFQPAE